MKFLIAVATILSMSAVSLADNNATQFKIDNGQIIVAQTYCRIFSTTLRLVACSCNGSGTCIQACDDALVIAANKIADIDEGSVER